MAADANGFDDRVWRELRLTIKEVSKIAVRVGIIGDQAGALHNGGPFTNAEIGAIHEYGAPGAGIPERPFVRSTFTFRRAELIELQAAAARAIIEGRLRPEKAIALIGAWGAGAVREQILKYGAFLFAPLAPSTIARKGSSQPLVETGQMVRSISFVVLRVT